jgi:hypothetical protein
MVTEEKSRAGGCAELEGLRLDEVYERKLERLDSLFLVISLVSLACSVSCRLCSRCSAILGAERWLQVRYCEQARLSGLV